MRMALCESCIPKNHPFIAIIANMAGAPHTTTKK